MKTPGPPPTLTNLKILRGNPGKRRLNDREKYPHFGPDFFSGGTGFGQKLILLHTILRGNLVPSYPRTVR